MKNFFSILLLLLFINCIKAQYIVSRGDSIGWLHIPAYLKNSEYPAISVYGENGGTAFYHGYNKKGIYMTLNEKILLWDSGNFIQVQLLPKDLLNMKSDTVDIEPLFLPDGKRNFNLKNSFGDNLFPYPCGKKGKVSWAYPAGTVTVVFPIVWINDTKAIYHGSDLTNAYITDTATNQILKWDGNKLVTVKEVPPKLVINRDEFIRNPASLVPGNYKSSDPYLLGQVYENNEIGWYYPRDPDMPYTLQQYPIVFIYTKNGGKAVYNGYDSYGSYLTVNNNHFIWDGENITEVDKIPAKLYNTGAPKKYNFFTPPVFNPAKVNEPGDQFMPGYNSDDIYKSYLQTEIQWKYNDQYPTVYKKSGIGIAEYRSECEFTYHGYNEKGSYLSLPNNLNFLWNGAELIPVKDIPTNVYNRPQN